MDQLLLLNLQQPLNKVKNKRSITEMVGKERKWSHKKSQKAVKITKGRKRVEDINRNKEQGK